MWTGGAWPIFPPVSPLVALPQAWPPTSQAGGLSGPCPTLPSGRGALRVTRSIQLRLLLQLQLLVQLQLSLNHLLQLLFQLCSSSSSCPSPCFIVCSTFFFSSCSIPALFKLHLHLLLQLLLQFLIVFLHTPGRVGEGATVYCLGEGAGEGEGELVDKLFSSIGLCRWEEGEGESRGTE